MKWLDRWFFRKWQWAWENRDIADVIQQPSTTINKLDNGRAIIEEDVAP